MPESPRWRSGRLWLSDMYGRRVLSVDLEGRVEVVAEVEGDQPSGLGFLPDGTPLLVLKASRRIVAIGGGRLRTYADLSGLPGDHLNDMIVDAGGRAYVDLRAGAPVYGPGARPAAGAGRDSIVLVGAEGRVGVAAEGLTTPNGLAISPDGRSLLVAETQGRRIQSFEIAADGSLGDRRVFAHTGDGIPDGICLDAEGAVWAALPNLDSCVRLLPTGAVSATVSVPGKQVIACALGGEDRRTLFLMSAVATWESHSRGEAEGSIETVRVPVPGAGLP